MMRTATSAFGASQGPDFAEAGTALYEWLGEQIHEATEKAAVAALVMPGEPYLVGYFPDPTLPGWRSFVERQRRAVRLWFRSTHPEMPGALKLRTRTVLHPSTRQDVRAVVVVYESKSPVPSSAVES